MMILCRFLYSSGMSTEIMGYISFDRSRCKVINDGVRSCISNQIKVFIFVNNRNQILLRIPTVTKDNHIFFCENSGCDFRKSVFFCCIMNLCTGTLPFVLFFCSNSLYIRMFCTSFFYEKEYVKLFL